MSNDQDTWIEDEDRRWRQWIRPLDPANAWRDQTCTVDLRTRVLQAISQEDPSSKAEVTSPVTRGTAEG
jgi:hypothetical protein